MGGEKNSGALWMARHVALCTIIVITSRRGIFTTIMQHSAMWIILQLIHGSICLGDKFFRVGFTRNSGGWKGAYLAEGSFSLTGLRGPELIFLRNLPRRLSSTRRQILFQSISNRKVWRSSQPLPLTGVSTLRALDI